MSDYTASADLYDTTISASARCWFVWRRGLQTPAGLDHRDNVLSMREQGPMVAAPRSNRSDNEVNGGHTS
jgi:hypothetical protein